MDAGGDTDTSEGFGNYVTAGESVEVAFLQDVDEIVLDVIQFKRDDPVGIVLVSDIVFFGGPICKVELHSEFTECLSGGFDVCTVEDGEGGLSLPESLDLRELFHFEWEE